MISKGMTVKEAAQKWVSEFNAIPQAMIGKLMQIPDDYWEEVTTPRYGDRVCVFDLTENIESGDIEDYIEDIDAYIVRLDNGNLVEVGLDCIDVERYESLPMWGTMWSFGDSIDDEWLERENGIQIMSECGFRIYYSEEFGYYFGIDGAGYDFYEAHWIPLYTARGLQWHDPEADA